MPSILEQGIIGDELLSISLLVWICKIWKLICASKKVIINITEKKSLMLETKDLENS